MFPHVNGKLHVGQSGDITRRLASHVRSGKLAASALAKVKRYEALRGKTAREIAEQLRMNKLGGIGNLANKRNPIGPARRHLLP